MREAHGREYHAAEGVIFLEEMVPKEYLGQIRLYDIRLRQKMDELEQLREASVSASANMICVSAKSAPRDKVSGYVSKIVDLETEIRQDMQSFLTAKNAIINKIQSADNPVYIEVLYKRYVQYKPLETIAEEMGYSPDRIRHLHGIALNDFKSRHTKAHFTMV